MESYYSAKLSGQRLKQCYDLAPAAVQRYLRAETNFVKGRIDPGDYVLELGCGYGRILRELLSSSGFNVGIDTSLDSLRMARGYLDGWGDFNLLAMNAVNPAFSSGAFDVVFCVQNGISAFHVDQRTLIRNAIRIVKKGGTVLFSSYAKEFWEDRLEWFRTQASHGLVGEIEEAATGDGTIICKDGFSATTVTEDQFAELSAGLGSSRTIQVVAGSSVFCEIVV